ncbi:hypothetical protein B0J17DRAFT_634187 [Rhizoctonia solani]|nr:hypothetical protein B0J17DRAFT_634187 [Rhizoctonia solani]
MLKARALDEKRRHQIVSVDELKKIARPKTKVPFIIHDCSNSRAMVTPKSTGEEVLFKLGRHQGSPVKLHENAFFYTQVNWDGDGTKPARLGLMSKPTLCPKKGFADFNDYFKHPELQGSIHFDQQANIKTRVEAKLNAPDCIGILGEARAFISAEDKRKSVRKWLIEIPSASLNKDPPFDEWGPKPKAQYKSARPVYIGTSTSIGSATTSSTQMASQGLGTSGRTNATNHVKAMVEKMENERKEAERREKEKKEKGGERILWQNIWGNSKK